MFIARNLTFFPGSEYDCQELSDEIIIPSYQVNKFMDRFRDNEPLILKLENTENNRHYIVAFGQGHTFDKNTIFVPQWILDILGHNGISDIAMKLTRITQDIPTASKIIIKPLDPMAFEIDTIGCFEKALMNLHTIQENITIPIQVPELGKDYVMFAYIEKVEPASISRIIDGEVGVDFINDFVTATASAATATATATASNAFTASAAFTTEVSTTTNSQPAPSTNPHTVNTTPPTEPIPELSAEQRREQVRQSWLKRIKQTQQ
jgi:Ubiquitin fusion degradation protein UFD1